MKKRNIIQLPNKEVILQQMKAVSKSRDKLNEEYEILKHKLELWDKIREYNLKHGENTK